MLPIYKATLNDVNDGIINISLVDEPAVEVDFITLSKENELQTFKSVNEEKHLLTGVIMTANKLIYRRNGDYEYYIKYEPETIRLMAEKLLSDMAHENIDIDHKQELLDKGKVLLQELWIKTQDKPGPFENIEDGSLLATYHVYDEDIWNMCKSDRFNGFSLCGYFGVEQEFKNNKSKISMLDKIKKAIKDILVNFGEIKTDKSIIYYDGDELVEGLEVTNEEGISLEDGDYTTEDKRIITIKDSKIEKIVSEEEIESADKKEDEKEDKKEDVVGDDNNDVSGDSDTDDKEVVEKETETNDEIEVLKSEIENLKSEIENLKEAIKKISETPAATPVAEEFKQVVNIKENKAAKIASYLKA